MRPCTTEFCKYAEVLSFLAIVGPSSSTSGQGSPILGTCDGSLDAMYFSGPFI